jgi:hypothetical protein
MGGPAPVAAFELQHDSAVAIALEPFIGNRGAGDAAAQAFELLALMHATKYCRASFIKTPLAPVRFIPPAVCGLTSGAPCVRARGRANLRG